MVLIPAGTGVVGREKPALAIAIVQLSQVSGPSHDVVMRII